MRTLREDGMRKVVAGITTLEEVLRVTMGDADLMSTLKSSEIQMNDLLELAVEEGASDLHLAVGLPPVLRINGSLAPLDAEPLTPEDTERLMKSIAPEQHIQQHARQAADRTSASASGTWRGSA